MLIENGIIKTAKTRVVSLIHAYAKQLVTTRVQRVNHVWRCNAIVSKLCQKSMTVRSMLGKTRVVESLSSKDCEWPKKLDCKKIK